MYFSLITPTPGAEREAAIQWAKGPYEQHQWLWQFLVAESGTCRDFIFRRRESNSNFPGYYVVSSRKPMAINNAWQVNSKEYDPQLSVGQRLAFELRANPVVTSKVEGKSRRNDAVMHEKKKLLEQRGLKRWNDWRNDDPEKPLLYQLVQKTSAHWLEHRAESCGFALVDMQGGEDNKSIHVDNYQQLHAANKNIHLSTVDFSGVLKVNEPLLFKKTLFGGIGHAKAFGCGLMLIRPA